jgi:hypothetical protein
MARFAGECQKRFMAVVRKLEVTLGPDTAELGMRFGLHSGAVTAGVLRGMVYVSDRSCLYMHHGCGISKAYPKFPTTGERARFQLFGDTGRC